MSNELESDRAKVPLAVVHEFRLGVIGSESVPTRMVFKLVTM
jgi:hypothetical protein